MQEQWVLACVEEKDGILTAKVYVAEGRQLTPVALRRGSPTYIRRALRLAFRWDFVSNVAASGE
jgi:hypothetical protein